MSSFDIISGPPGTFAYFEPTMGIAITSPVSKETRTIRAQENADAQNQGYFPWGTNNLRPFEIIEEIDQSALLDPIIDRKVEILSSGGIMYGTTIIDGPKKIFNPMIIPEIEDFLEKIEANRHIRESTIDYYTFKNTFTEMTVDVGRRVTGIYNNDASECRIGVQNTSGRRKGMIDYIYVSADWRDNNSADTAEKTRAIDPYFDVAGQIREGRSFKYIIPDRLQTRGRKAYQRGPIENLMASGWLDISKAIPRWKSQIMDNQISIKYHIEVSEDYWMRKYPDYTKLSASKQKDIERKEIAAFLKFFKDKRGAALMTRFKQQGGHEYSDWKITVIGGDKKQFGEAAYIEDDVQSGYVITRGMGMPPILIGVAPGKGGMGAGSGSDFREAYNAYLLGCKADQRHILRPYYYAANVNGWNDRYGGPNKRLEWIFENYHLSTLDHGRETKRIDV